MTSDLSRRQFLAMSGMLPAVAACGCGQNAPSASPAAPTPPTGAPAQVTFRQDFNATPAGVYDAAALAAGWNGAPPSTGVREGRVSVYEGSDAREGRSLRVLYPRGGVSSQPSGAQWKMSTGRYSDPTWAPSKDERVDFDQFVVGTGRL
jgi:hypothetical protein